MTKNAEKDHDKESGIHDVLRGLEEQMFVQSYLCKRNVIVLHSRKKREKVLINHLGNFDSSYSMLLFFFFNLIS